MKSRSALKKRFQAGILSWFIIGTVVIFACLFTIMTLQSLEKQKEQTIRLLLEKGEALIRSFEAVARTGVGMKWSAFQLQKLLIEMAEQPGIDYIIVINTEGAILADSDPARIGEIYGTDLDLRMLSKTKETAWRQVPNTIGADTFEVYRPFSPTQEPFAGFRESSKAKSPDGLFIFVGMDMGPVLKARKADEQRIIWVAVTLLLIGCFGVISLFFSYRYRTTRASLSRIRAFSDHLVENMPIGLIAVDKGRKVIAINAAAASILDLTVSGTLGKPATQMLPPVCRDLLENLETEKRIIEKELDCPLHEGKTVPLPIIASTLEEEGEIHGFVILLRDLTEIRFLKKEVARSQRLAALGDLAAGVAHEIRNPLSSIKGFATYFKERYRHIPEDRQTAEIMINEVERLNRVIGQLLEFARPMTLHRQKTPLALLIHHVSRMVEDQGQSSGIKLNMDELVDMEVDIDPDKMKQVFLNLFLNAMAAMESGGTITVRSFPVDQRFMGIQICDTGVGIQKSDLGRIFDPYFTTKPSGTGLGLAIVHKILEAHGGEAIVDSEPGRGTTVTLTLPL